MASSKTTEIWDNVSQAELAMTKCHVCLDTLFENYCFEDGLPRDLNDHNTMKMIYEAERMSAFIIMAVEYFGTAYDLVRRTLEIFWKESKSA